jgi:hypothetical protein
MFTQETNIRHAYCGGDTSDGSREFTSCAPDIGPKSPRPPIRVKIVVESVCAVPVLYELSAKTTLTYRT